MKGILFKPDMIKAITEGRKTVTRRLAGLKEINKQPNRWILEKQAVNFKGILMWSFYDKDRNTSVPILSRYRVGETVYIKEAWSKSLDGQHILFKSQYDNIREALNIPDLGLAFKSPLFLRAEDARYFIKILDVRPERLQEITNEDITREGFGDRYTDIGWAYVFGQAWNHINPKHPWSSNPWLWRYEFELVRSEKS